MSKRTTRWLLSLMLVLAMCSACFLPASASGSKTADKPTKAEIQQMWLRVTSTTEIYDETPSVTSPYKAGKLDAAFLQTGLTMANYVRFVANLPLLQLDATLNEDAQHGAVLMAAEDNFSHFPPQPADMSDEFYERGYDATSSSNIHANYGYAPKDTLKLAVYGFMADEDEYNNDVVGHRRWILNPTLKYIGFGFAQSSSWNYVDMCVFDHSGAAVDYDFIAWPAEGNFPTNLMDASFPWSVTLNPSLYKSPDLSQVKVTLTRKTDGKTWKFDSATGTPGDPANAFLTVDNNGYGVPNCIIFNPGTNNIDGYNGVFTIDVSGISKADGSAATLHYEVDFFDVDAYEAPECVDHNFKVEQTNATCTAAGSVKKTCTICGYVTTETIPALGHSWGEASVVTAPTCTATGTQERTCATCGAKETTELPALEHDFESVVTNPTCTEAGYTTYTCADCGHVETGNEVAALGHDNDEYVVDPTCTEDGYTLCTCAVCGHEEVTDIVTAPGHSWDAGEITKEPTEDTPGERVHTCTVCGVSETVEIPALNSVCRISGKTRYQTATKAADAMKDQLGIDKFSAVIVASGEAFPDALAGSYLASVKDAPILLVNLQTMVDLKNYIRSNLEEGGDIYILGGEGAIPQSMESGLGEYNVVRLSGKTRYETNLAILKEAGVEDQEILVCTGNGFADSLSASAAGRPILLVGSSLTEGQKEFLSQQKREFVIIGGTGAVNTQIQSELMDYGSTERVSGKNRYETSVKVAQRFFDDPDTAVLAYAKNFPDGLCGGPLALSMNAPLILTATGDESAAVSYAKTCGITRGAVLGGTGLISDASVRSIFQMKQDSQIFVR